jgi:hypothetical protein
MRVIVLMLLLLPLALPAQHPTAGPTPSGLRVGLTAPAPALVQDEPLIDREVLRETPRWVYGGAIGAFVGALLMLGLASVAAGLSEQDVSYLRAAGIGAFGGFVLGALIVGD